MVWWGFQREKEKDWVWECSGMVASLRDAKDSLRLSLAALSSLGIEGCRGGEWRSVQVGKKLWNCSLVHSLSADDEKLSEGGRRRSGFVRAGALERHAGGWLGKVGLQAIGSKSGQKVAAVAKRSRPARGVG